MRDKVTTVLSALALLSAAAGLVDSGFFILALLLFFLTAYIDNLPKRSDSKPTPVRPTETLKTRKYTPNTSVNLHEETELVLFQVKKREYLKSSEWATKRAFVLARDDFKCQSCSIDTDLNIHHISYKNLGNEPLEHLICLCQDCHTDLHERVGYPQTYKEYMDFHGPLK